MNMFYDFYMFTHFHLLYIHYYKTKNASQVLLCTEIIQTQCITIFLLLCPQNRKGGKTEIQLLYFSIHPLPTPAYIVCGHGQH